MTPLKAIGVVRLLEDLAGATWRREGTWFVTRCPFHDDGKTPNFKVGTDRPDRGQCFSCGAKGDVIELTRRLRDCSALEAMKFLAARYADAAPASSAAASSSRTSAEAYERALELADALTADSQVGRYLEGRRILQAAGVCDVAGVNRSRQWYEGVSRALGGREAMKASGLSSLYAFAKNDVPFVLFGHRTPAGVTNLQARRIVDVGDDRPRLIMVGPEAAPFGFASLARFPDGPVIFCEGPTDALSWHANRFAALGVPGLQAWRPWYLDLVDADRWLVVIGDADEAGAGVERWALDAHARGLNVRVCTYRGIHDRFAGKDANELLVAGADHDQFARITRAGRVPDPRHLPKPGSRTRPLPPVAASGEAREPRASSRAPAAPGPPTPAARGPAPPDAAGGAPAEAGQGPAPIDNAGEAPAGSGPRSDPQEAPRGEDTGGDDEVTVDAGQPLADLIEQLHWGDDKRADRVKPPHRLTDAVIRWFVLGGGTFLRDRSGHAFLYFRRRLYSVEKRDKNWQGFLYEVGRINLDDPEGKLIARALEQHALSLHEGPQLCPWVYFDEKETRLAVHLHGRADVVVYARRRGYTVEANGKHGLLLEDDETTRPIEMPRRPDVGAALEALDRLLVKNLATSTHERSLFVGWVLSCMLRQALSTRALLFCQGPSGSGKSEATKLATTLIHGVPRLIAPTIAALYEEARAQPLIVLDNQETKQLAGDDALQQFLLLSATGAVRKKRLEGTSRGIVDQKTDALVCVTAIEPPARDELIQRTVGVTFDRTLHSRTFHAPTAIRALNEARGLILGGLLRLFSERLLERLDEVNAFNQLVPADHPKRRLGQHLGLIALIVDVCHRERPGMWRSGRDELRDWLTTSGALALELAAGTDPIVAGLSTLQWSWNRVVRLRGETSRPAWDGALYRCKPAFRADPLLNLGDPWTDDPKKALQLPTEDGRPVVAGFIGSYEDILADMHRAEHEERGTGELRRRIGSVAAFSARWRNNRAIEEADWFAEMWSDTSRPRTYLFGRGRHTRADASPEGEGDKS